MKGQTGFLRFQEVVKSFGRDASPNRHFGEQLKKAMSSTDDKRVKATFTVSESDSKSFLVRLLIKDKGWRAGMVTAIAYNMHSLRMTIYEPSRNTLIIPLDKLDQFFIEQQPRDGTMFVIRDEILIKVNCNEPIKPEDSRHEKKPVLPPDYSLRLQPLEK